MLRERIPMKRLPPQRAKNHHLQRAGKEISLFAIFHGGVVLRRLDSSDVSLGLEQNSMRGFDSSQEEIAPGSSPSLLEDRRRRMGFKTECHGHYGELARKVSSSDLR